MYIIPHYTVNTVANIQKTQRDTTEQLRMINPYMSFTETLS